ncbi:MAG: hypothetical protein AAFN92_19335 [Bacteroidota bacterium]
MKNAFPQLSAQELAKGLEIIELEERLEMIHLSAIEAEGSTRCDLGGGDVKTPEVSIDETGQP